MLLEEEPVTIGSTIPNQLPENYRLWEVWDKHGIPKPARAYMALKVGLPATIPPIHNAWEEDGQIVTLVQDRSHWPLLVSKLNEPDLALSQIIYWLDYTLKLWVLLEPWKMRHSLLELSNLLVDEDGIICLQRLYPEQSGRKLNLVDLAKLWRLLLDQLDTEAPSILVDLIHAIEHQELSRIEELRSQLQQIAYDLEPKPQTQPLGSGDISQSHEAPTVVLDKRIIALEEAAVTHTGKKRDHNEDCFGIVAKVERQYSPKGQSVSARGLYILCDGMGGHDSGEVASAMTVDLLREYFATHWQDTMPDEKTIRDGICATNQALFEVNQQNSASGSGRMGTTLVMLLIQDRTIAIAHVGDSRCYAITPSQGLIQLTLDHEVGQQQILRGVDPDIAYGRPDAYQLTQAIGPRDRNYIAPDINFFELQEDTLLILASDGLTDNQLLETHWLTNAAPLLSTNANLQQGVERLIDFANEYNGHDNITALVIRAKFQG
jgi:serine/threonine protein phosphatase PrpC